MGASYVVGSPGRYATPKGRLTKLEGAYLTQSWSQVREGLMVKQLPQEGETYVLALSAQRVHKERAMRKHRLKRYVARLKALAKRSAPNGTPC